MKCNRCGKEVIETEMFCDDCKKHLKSFSSRKSVRELENLIVDNKSLTDLENTKELVNLDKLVEEELLNEEMKEDLEQKTISFEVKENVEEKIDVNRETIKGEKKNNKKKIIIVTSIISSILIILSIFLIIFLNKEDKNIDEEVKIDYEKVIKTYGDKVSKIVENYILEFNDIPTWQFVIEKIDYDRYEVECSIHNIYKDGSIYLSSCKVDNKSTKVEYGKEIEEVKEGKKIEIYKQELDGTILYTDNKLNSNLVGTITCKTEECNFVDGFDNYVLIEEESAYYLYDYTNDLIVFGPFGVANEFQVLAHNNILYGIFYQENNKNNIYSVKTEKVLKDIKGSLLNSNLMIDPTIMYKYNYVIFINNGVNEFVNLNTGNVSYKIKGNISSFIENNNIVYIMAYTAVPSNFKIYNSNGKEMFDGKEYNKFILGSSNFLVSTENTFRVYDSNLNLKTSSKTYDEILGLYESFVVAKEENNILLLDIKDNKLATIENNNYILNNCLTKSTEKGISLVLEDSKTEKTIEYFYSYTTKKINIVED